MFHNFLPELFNNNIIDIVIFNEIKKIKYLFCVSSFLIYCNTAVQKSLLKININIYSYVVL